MAERQTGEGLLINIAEVAKESIVRTLSMSPEEAARIPGPDVIRSMGGARMTELKTSYPEADGVFVNSLRRMGLGQGDIDNMLTPENYSLGTTAAEKKQPFFWQPDQDVFHIDTNFRKHGLGKGDQTKVATDVLTTGAELIRFFITRVAVEKELDREVWGQKMKKGMHSQIPTEISESFWAEIDQQLDTFAQSDQLKMIAKGSLIDARLTGEPNPRIYLFNKVLENSILTRLAEGPQQWFFDHMKSDIGVPVKKKLFKEVIDNVDVLDLRFTAQNNLAQPNLHRVSALWPAYKTSSIPELADGVI